MKNSKIEWCDHTFNAWEGCIKVSPGCANCYAEERNKRYHAGNNWGPGAPRLRRSDTYWNEPLKWNKEAASLGVRPRVFCSSLADWLDEEGPVKELERLLSLIHRTQNLDWLLLSKRPQNFVSRLRAVQRTMTVDPLDIVDRIDAWISGERFPFNVWIGTTVEDQQRADERIPELLKIPALIRFLSCEPLLSEIFIDQWLWGRQAPCKGCPQDGDCECGFYPRNKLDGEASISWVICGGESGPKARPMHLDWARSLRDQCQTGGVPFHFKQWGEYGQVTGSRIGKKSAGRVLDNRTWDEFPHSVQPNP